MKKRKFNKPKSKAPDLGAVRRAMPAAITDKSIYPSVSGRQTKITKLPTGANLGSIDDLNFFKGVKHGNS